MSHSKEPWSTDKWGSIRDALGQGVYSDSGASGDLSTDDTARIVACVNACRGIPTEALNAGVVKNAVNFWQSDRETSGTGNLSNWDEAIAYLTRQP